MQHDPKGRITLQKTAARIRILAGDTVIVDSRDAVELRETDYPPRFYLPREDIAMDRLQESKTATHCPFKGDATYYNLLLEDRTIADAAWSYEEPYADMMAIRGHLAFASSELMEDIGED